MDESSRESKDLDGRADCENGVIGDVRPADVGAPLPVFLSKDVMSCGGDWFVRLMGAGGLCIADKAM